VKPYDDCIYCGGTVDEKLGVLDYRYKGRLFIVENVTMGVCCQCGEKYLKADVARKIEALAKDENSITSTMSVPVLKAS
jgi:YgiT-type zinc finger domain-containing protein